MIDTQPRPLTPKQQRVLDWLHEYQAEHDRPATVREICTAFGVTINAAWCRLRQLERKGCLTLTPRTARCIRLTPRPGPLATRQGDNYRVGNLTLTRAGAERLRDALAALPGEG